MAILTEHLRRRCLALPADSRADLAGMLLYSLEGKPRRDKGRTLEAIRRAVLDTYGVDPLTRSRQQPAPDCKVVAAFLALDLLPVSQSDVARWMGVRPCTINYYERRMRSAIELPGSDPQLITEYQTIYKRYAENET